MIFLWIWIPVFQSLRENSHVHLILSPDMDLLSTCHMLGSLLTYGYKVENKSDITSALMQVTGEGAAEGQGQWGENSIKTCKQKK